MTRPTPTFDFPPTLALSKAPKNTRSVFATTNIKKGDLLFREPALTSDPYPFTPGSQLPVSAVDDIIVALKESQSPHAMAIYHMDPIEPVPSTNPDISNEQYSLMRNQMRANAFSGLVPGSKTHHFMSLYVLGTYFNHSCWPNAISFKEDNLDVSYYALEDIEQGSEVCVCYRDDVLHLPTDRRRAALKASHKFVCVCRRCGDPEHPRSDSAVGVKAIGAKWDQDVKGMEREYESMRKVHAEYFDFEGAKEAVKVCTEFIESQKLGDVHWRVFEARQFLVEALMTVRDYCPADDATTLNIYTYILTKAIQSLINHTAAIMPALHQRRYANMKGNEALLNEEQMNELALMNKMYGPRIGDGEVVKGEVTEGSESKKE